MGFRDRIRPVFSSRADDPALVEAIEAFVAVLAERIDHLQDAEVQGDHPKLEELAVQLATEAKDVGYEEMARLAATVADAARSEKRDETHASLVELTELSQRVRLGHPGAF